MSTARSIIENCNREISIEMILEDKLLELLPGYHIEEVKSIEDSEDETYNTTSNILTKYDWGQIEKIVYDFNGFWSSTTIFLYDETKIRLHSSNLKTDDPNYTVDDQYEFVSPRFRYSGPYIHLDRDIVNWLKNMGISAEAISEAKECHTFPAVYEYKGIQGPCRCDEKGNWWYSSTPPQLTSAEIKRILEYIKEDDLMVKVHAILTAPFNRKGPNRPRY